MRKSRRTVLLALLALVGACQSSEPAPTGVVEQVSDGAIVPGLGSAAETIDVLAEDIAEFCAAPWEEGLDNVRASWATAQQAWDHAEPTTTFGPAEMLRTLSMVDYRPASGDGIAELVASTEAIDADYMENRAASTQRGLAAVEWVLFGEPNAATNDRACELGLAAAAVAAEHAALLEEAWVAGVDGDAAYRDEMVGEMAPEVALADIVGAMVATFHRLGSRQLGVALGLTASDPDPTQLPEGPAGQGAVAFLSEVEGVVAVLEAGGAESLLSLIRARSPEVAEAIEADLAYLREELGAIDTPLVTMVEESPDELVPIHDAMLRLHTLFEADVVSALDLTLGFSDTDGDSGSGG